MLSVDEHTLKALDRNCQNYLKHIFELLGSGPVCVEYGLKAKGFDGNKYDEKGDDVLKKIAAVRLKHRCESTYKPIHWCVDFKSGFRFLPWKYSPSKCIQDIGLIKGAEIKVPWELGRCYHLVQIGLLALGCSSKERERLIREFRDECIDFIKMNPIGKTIQWSAPMDVSIRMVNLLIAFDLFNQMDSLKILQGNFSRLFEKHIYGSLRYLMNNLEYYSYPGSNHYLSNIAGIIFSSSYLPRNEWTDACLVFGVQELIDQVSRQFYPEGAHFEGSTSYHRLSAEFVIYSVALVLGVIKTDKKEAFLNYSVKAISRLKKKEAQKYECNGTFFPQTFVDRIYNMGLFTKTVLKHNNEIVQIGDNDSGRLMKISPTGNAFKDNVLDHRTLLSALSGLYDDRCFSDYIKAYPLECDLIRAITKNTILRAHGFDAGIVDHIGQNNVKEKKYGFAKTKIMFESPDRTLRQNIRAYYYEKFGVVVVRGDRVFISMVIDTAEHARYYGHTHNDKLSIEIMVDGKYLTRDPGNYVYTSSPILRDRFRGTEAHNCPFVDGIEQNYFTGLFDVKKRTHAKLLYCGCDGIIGIVRYGKVEHMREVCLNDCSIVVKDYMNVPFGVNYYPSEYAEGYGELRKGNYDSK